ncbi:hypothetical protein [Humisphaera borealis]|uniref:Uncharacterized protein n=1 Tax=Humisphaera borealis TaxID=2807512 RepID=A0A7M2WT39_9BACT|nr:hypothetical protein [Humisphaera borealis]QOV88434.1 hypothetical protein IPV69_19590 [Humisphaera borealis]
MDANSSNTSDSSLNVMAAATIIGTFTAAELRTLCGLLAGELATAKSAAEPELVTREEIQRRSGFLAARAVSAATPGKLLCRWCGSAKNGFDGLRRHYASIHADDIRAMPASNFGDAFGAITAKRKKAAAFDKATGGAFAAGKAASSNAGPSPAQAGIEGPSKPQNALEAGREAKQ